mmetsp:Transcript_14374/g.34774  ORF Transcript_14374/g.34774 Transcript_14374/m.34774 type:complete len:111 (+) Transcript_14374:2403-2735(+)
MNRIGGSYSTIMKRHEKIEMKILNDRSTGWSIIVLELGCGCSLPSSLISSSTVGLELEVTLVLENSMNGNIWDTNNPSHVNIAYDSKRKNIRNPQLRRGLLSSNNTPFVF